MTTKTSEKLIVISKKRLDELVEETLAELEREAYEPPIYEHISFNFVRSEVRNMIAKLRRESRREQNTRAT
jgi:hypothetical protein